MRVLRAVIGFVLPALAGSAFAAELPAPGPPVSIGAAAHGCLQGAVALPLSGPGWQVLRPAQNRFWGNPVLIALIEEQAKRSQPLGSLLIGDLSLPRGGRMPSGHASHQTGLDADILFRLADHPLAVEERDDPDLSGVLQNGRVLAERWGRPQFVVLRSFAQDPRVERIFVNSAIKRHLCRSVRGGRGWLHRIRPWWGHTAHFHIRLNCPAGDGSCEPGPPIADGDGCGKELDWWLTAEAAAPAPPPSALPPPRYLPSMPAACKAILEGQ